HPDDLPLRHRRLAPDERAERARHDVDAFPHRQEPRDLVLVDDERFHSRDLRTSAEGMGRSGENIAARRGYCQRTSFNATAQETGAQSARIPSSPPIAASERPSSMTARRALLSAVRGSAWMNGCAAFGKRSAEKKTPEKSHIGTMTRFIRPLAASRVRARAATSRPMPPKQRAPTIVSSASSAIEP